MYRAIMAKERKNAISDMRSEERLAVRENHTGIPTQLKDRIEQSTGLSLHDVRVHYNSALPAKLDALAYTKGNQVEVGPGQERHLPHELGHVVQQKLGTVRANAMHSSGVALNTDPGLEHQADEIGAGKRVEIASAGRSEIIQCAPRDRKKEKWEQDRGRLNWKHKRKNEFDRKHPVFGEDSDANAFRLIASEEQREMDSDEHGRKNEFDMKQLALEVDTDANAPCGIVSKRLREVDFDETHYLAPYAIPIPLFLDKKNIVEEFQKNIDEFLKEIKYRGKTDSKITQQTLKETLPKYPKLQAFFIGNCDGPENFLYEVQGEETAYKVYFYSKKLIVKKFRKNINDFLAEIKYIGDFNVKISRQKLRDTLQKYPVIRACSEGNCGVMANFLYEVKGDFGAFIEELKRDVPEKKVKLIKVDANIGHTFTLICYKTDDKTVIELIQAWQGAYSVRESLRGGNVFINRDLIGMFDVMHRSIRDDEGNKYLKKIFLLDNTKIKKGIDKFDISDWRCNTLDKSPEEYAEHIASKKLFD